MRGVLGQAAIADLGVAKLAFDHAEWMLHLRTHTCFEVFPTFFLAALAFVANGLNRRTLGGNEKTSLAGLQFFAFVRTGVAAVAEHTVFFAVQQCVGH